MLGSREPKIDPEPVVVEAGFEAAGLLVEPISSDDRHRGG